MTGRNMLVKDRRKWRKRDVEEEKEGEKETCRSDR